MLLRKRENDEQGFILVVSLLILLVLTIIGIAANRNTTTELLIAGNDKVYKETFLNADGGAEVAQELLEQNLACIPGFSSTEASGDAILDDFVNVTTNSLDFWLNSLSSPLPDISYTSRDMYLPWDYAATDGIHTNMNVAGDTRLTTGAAIQMAAGYEGKGKGICAGGTWLLYVIRSQHYGKINSCAIVRIGYRHIIGTEAADCWY